MSHNESKIKLVKIDNYSKSSKNKGGSTKKKQHYDYLQNIVRKSSETFNGGEKKDVSKFLNNANEIQKLLSKKKLKIKNDDLKKTLMKMEQKAKEKIEQEQPIKSQEQEKPIKSQVQEKPIKSQVQKQNQNNQNQNQNNINHRQNNNINNTNFLGKIKELEKEKKQNPNPKQESKIPRIIETPNKKMPEIKKSLDLPKKRISPKQRELKVRKNLAGKKIKKKDLQKAKSISQLKKISPKELREKFLKKNLGELKREAN
jgi:hypothetical protein